MLKIEGFGDAEADRAKLKNYIDKIGFVRSSLVAGAGGTVFIYNSSDMSLRSGGAVALSSSLTTVLSDALAAAGLSRLAPRAMTPTEKTSATSEYTAALTTGGELLAALERALPILQAKLDAIPTDTLPDTTPVDGKCPSGYTMIDACIGKDAPKKCVDSNAAKNMPPGSIGPCPTTTVVKAGVPTWVWIAGIIAAVGAVGTTIYFVRRKK